MWIAQRDLRVKRDGKLVIVQAGQPVPEAATWPKRCTTRDVRREMHTGRRPALVLWVEDDAAPAAASPSPGDVPAVHPAAEVAPVPVVSAPIEETAEVPKRGPGRPPGSTKKNPIDAGIELIRKVKAKEKAGRKSTTAS